MPVNSFSQVKLLARLATREFPSPAHDSCLFIVKECGANLNHYLVLCAESWKAFGKTKKPRERGWSVSAIHGASKTGWQMAFSI